MVDRLREGLGVSRRDVQPGLAVAIRKLDPGSQTRCHDRFATDMGLEDGDTKGFASRHRRKREYSASVEMVHQALLRQFPRKMYCPPELGSHFPATLAFGTVTRYYNWHINLWRSPNKILQSLIIAVFAREQHVFSSVPLLKPADIGGVGVLKLFRDDSKRHNSIPGGQFAQYTRRSDVLLGGRDNGSSFSQKMHLDGAVYRMACSLADHVAVVSHNEGSWWPCQKPGHLGGRVRHMHYDHVSAGFTEVIGEERGKVVTLETAPFAHFGDAGSVPIDDAGAQRAAAGKGFDFRPLPLVPATQGDVPLHAAPDGGIEVLVYMQNLHGSPMSAPVCR